MQDVDFLLARLPQLLIGTCAPSSGHRGLRGRILPLAQRQVILEDHLLVAGLLGLRGLVHWLVLHIFRAGVLRPGPVLVLALDGAVVCVQADVVGVFPLVLDIGRLLLRGLVIKIIRLDVSARVKKGRLLQFVAQQLGVNFA